MSITFFSRQSFKRFTFRVKSSDAIFSLFYLLSLLRGKYCLIYLEKKNYLFE